MKDPSRATGIQVLTHRRQQQGTRFPRLCSKRGLLKCEKSGTARDRQQCCLNVEKLRTDKDAPRSVSPSIAIEAQTCRPPHRRRHTRINMSISARRSQISCHQTETAKNLAKLRTDGIEGYLKVLGGGEHDEVVSIELADVMEGVRGNKGDTRDRARLSMSRMKRRGERTLQCQSRPRVKTQSHQDGPGSRCPQRKLARRCLRWLVTPKSKRRTRVASPAGVKSLFDVDERDKGVLVAAEAQGVLDHSVGTPAETALGRV